MPIPNWRLCLKVLIVKCYVVYVILVVFLCFMILNVLVLQLMNRPCMQIVPQLITTYMHVRANLFVRWNHEFLMNILSAQLVTDNKVIPPTHVIETLPSSVEVILPTRFRVKTCFQVDAALNWVNMFPTLDRVNCNAAFEWLNKSSPVWVDTYVQVNLASEWVNMFNAHVRVNPPIMCTNMLRTCVWVNTCNHVNPTLQQTKS